MPILDILKTIDIAELAVQIIGLLASRWFMLNGIIYIIRSLSYFVDSQFVNLIGMIYKYFNLLLKGEMFNEQIVSQLLSSIYVFIGLIIFFRLATVLIKYLVNPETIESSSDSKSGLFSGLVKRIVIGSIMIALIPFIFSTMNKLQVAIIEDNVVQNIFIQNEAFKAFNKRHAQNGGQYLANYVLAGFIKPNNNSSSAIKMSYESMKKSANPDLININDGVVPGVIVKYSYTYYFIVSTFVLFYIFKIMIGYAIDIITRFFKTLLYQLMAPIAIVEYMISGNVGIFEKWKTSVIANYLSLFVRMLSIWFTIFILSLMTADGLPNGNLLKTDDDLLRAIIIIALIAFMKDLPNYVGQIIGFDLKQESSAMGIVSGAAKAVVGAAGAGLMAGSGIIGSSLNRLGGALNRNIGNKLAGAREASRNALNRGREMGLSGDQLRQASRNAIRDYGNSQVAERRSRGNALQRMRNTAAEGIRNNAMSDVRDSVSGLTSIADHISGLHEIGAPAAAQNLFNKMFPENRNQGGGQNNQQQNQNNQQQNPIIPRPNRGRHFDLLNESNLDNINATGNNLTRDESINNMTDFLFRADNNQDYSDYLQDVQNDNNLTSGVSAEDRNIVLTRAGINDHNSNIVRNSHTLEEIARNISSHSNGTISYEQAYETTRTYIEGAGIQAQSRYTVTESNGTTHTVDIPCTDQNGNFLRTGEYTLSDNNIADITNDIRNNYWGETARDYFDTNLQENNGVVSRK